MGMTIDNCIKDLLIQREDFLYELGSEEIDFIIATMRKYQKIEEIVNSKTTRLSYELGFRQIKEVIEDGKID